jgi:hypothetical protein
VGGQVVDLPLGLEAVIGELVGDVHDLKSPVLDRRLLATVRRVGKDIHRRC